MELFWYHLLLIHTFFPRTDVTIQCMDHEFHLPINKSVVFMGNVIYIQFDIMEQLLQGDLICVSELQQEIHNFKQGPLSITEFFTKLKRLLEELECYKPIFTCTYYVRCNFQAMRNARNSKHQDIIIQFLNGLNDYFSIAKFQIC